MIERQINGYWFRQVEGGEVEVAVIESGKRRVIKNFPLSAENQKVFDREISFWFMEHGHELER